MGQGNVGGLKRRDGKRQPYELRVLGVAPVGFSDESKQRRLFKLGQPGVETCLIENDLVRGLGSAGLFFGNFDDLLTGTLRIAMVFFDPAIELQQVIQSLAHLVIPLSTIGIAACMERVW